MHRDYDTGQRRPNIFLLNGRSFPFTLRDTPIDVRSGERVKLRVLNAEARTIALHTHGHHPIITALDGYPVPPAQRLARDVFSALPAQRVDLELRPGDDGRYASGPGVWLVHDHTEQAVTNNGINPGGDLTAIVYDGFRAADGVPRVATSLKRFFDPDYYRGKIPVFDPSIFHTRATAWPAPASPGRLRRPRRSPVPDPAGAGARAGRRDGGRASHRRHVVPQPAELPAHSRQGAGKPAGLAGRGLRLRAAPAARRAVPGRRAGRGEYRSVRHALMIPGLNPMFMAEFRGPATESAPFVISDRDITLPFHCHVATHEEMGMHCEIVVGRGGPATWSRTRRAVCTRAGASWSRWTAGSRASCSITRRSPASWPRWS